MNLPPDLIGTIAAIITTSCYIPQVWRCWRLRDVRAISFTMYVLLTLGIALWLVYGVLIESWPIIIANIITIFLTSSILLMKWAYRSSSPPSGSSGEQAILRERASTASSE